MRRNEARRLVPGAGGTRLSPSALAGAENDAASGNSGKQERISYFSTDPIVSRQASHPKHPWPAAQQEIRQLAA